MLLILIKYCGIEHLVDFNFVAKIKRHLQFLGCVSTTFLATVFFSIMT